MTISSLLNSDAYDQNEANPIPPDASRADSSLPGQFSVESVNRHLLTGTSVLALGVVIERGTGFIANILAARLGGASTFGAYSLAITTANNIATYAGAGIGSTAARFSGKYPYGQSGYRSFSRALMFISVTSAVVAGFALWLGAGPIATLLGQRGLIFLLQAAALSAMGSVVLECARGFFVGQRRLAALVVLSLVVGVGMLSLLPLAAYHHSPVRMILSQGVTTTFAVMVCMLLGRTLKLHSPSGHTFSAEPRTGLILREVWGFGFVQLAGLAGANAAGWWLTTLVAKADPSLIQMGFFGIASQLRNIVGLAPGLLTEGSFAVMADPRGEASRTPQKVLGFTTYTSCLASFLLASFGIVIAPWLLQLLYSGSYTKAAPVVAFALALAVMHMGNAPAAARLSILAIRTTAVINGIWAIFIAASGTVVMLRTGTAATAMVIYFAAHTLSSVLVLAMLASKESLPTGLMFTFVTSTVSTLALACMAALRSVSNAHGVAITGAMVVVFAGALALLVQSGRRNLWLASPSVLLRRVANSRSLVFGLFRRLPHGS